MSFPNKPQKPTNRPGLSQIAYRIGDYNSFRERLLSYLACYLPELKTRDPQDFAIALADSWAVVADVLSFYQERIANEGYLITATERRSILELARAIGYELKPGVAASTYLAFIVEDTPDGPREVKVPQEAQVMSVPNEGESPQTFETSEEIVARVDWNRITPRQSRPLQITNNTQQLYLEGIATQLQPGNSILLLDREDLEVARYLLTLTDVVAVPEAGHTLVSWKQPLKLDAPLRQPQVFAFRQQAALFGNLAPDWLEDVPNETKRTANATLKGGVFQTIDQGDRWFPLNTGLPNADILCLVVNQNNDFFVGTPGLGIFAKRDRGTTWQQLIAGLTNLIVETLYIDWERDYILAGTPGGGVFRSTDNGENWSSIGDGTIRVESSGEDDNKSVETVNTGLPDTVVHSLVTCSKPIEKKIGKLTNSDDSGTKFKVTNGTNVTEKLRVGDIITTADGQVRTVTNIDTNNSDTFLFVDFAFRPSLPNSGIDFSIGGTYLFAGTEAGVYRTQDQGKNWYLKGLSNRVIRSLLVSYRTANQGTGTITSEDTTVIGNETKFLTELQVGDRILANDQIRMIVDITSDTELTIETAFNPALDFEVSYSFLFYVSQGQGTISSTGTTVTGDGTNFKQEFNIGDLIVAEDQLRTIETIPEDDQLTTDTAFNPPLPAETVFSVPKRSQGTISSIGTEVTGVDTKFLSESQRGDSIIVGDQIKTITAIASDTELTIDSAFSGNLSDGTLYWILPVGKTHVFAGTDDGIFRSSDYGETWHEVNDGLSNKNVTSLATDFRVGTGTIRSDGINARVKGNGTNFINELKPCDTIVAAGQTRVIRTIDAQTELTVYTAFAPDLPVGTSFAIANRTDLFAGTANGGIFRSRNNGRTWEQVALKPGTGKITSEGNKVTGNNETVFGEEIQEGYAIIADGQIRFVIEIVSNNELILDQPLEPDLETETNFTINASVTNLKISSLGITSLVADAYLGTGTIARNAENSRHLDGSKTLFAQELRVGDSITAWGETRIVTGIDADNPDTELSIDRPFETNPLPAETNFTINNLFAGTVDGGVFRSVDRGDNWSEINGDVAAISPIRGLATKEITSLAIAKPGILLAGTRFSGFVEQEWPGFQLAAQKIDLDTLYTGILEDSWLVLVDGDRFEALQVENISDGSRRDFLLDTTITSIIPSAPVTTPTNFSLRNTDVLLQSEQLAMAQESLSVSSQQANIFRDPISISDNSIFLSKFVQGLKSGQELIFAGKHPRAKVKLGGMARSQNWNETETDAELEERIIQALRIIPGGYLLVGTNKGVDIFSSDDKGMIWQSISAELPSQNVTSFVTSSEEGIKTIVGNGTNILGRNTIFINQLQAGDFITVEDQTGTVKKIQTRAVKNIQSNEGLQIDKAFSISINGKSFTINKLFAGTAQGIFRFHADTRKWEQVNQQELKNVQTLAIKQVDNGDSLVQIFAGTQENGVWRSDDYGNNWTEINDGLTDQNIRSLLVNPDNSQIFAGTFNNGIFRSTDNGDRWKQIAYTKPGTGTISSTGTIVKGNRTAFGRELKPGDLIIAAGQTRVVTSFEPEKPNDPETADLLLNINTAFNPDLPARTTFDISTGLKDMSISELAISRQPQTISISSNGITVTGTRTNFLESLRSGDIILANNQIRTVNQIISDNQLTLDRPLSGCDQPVAIFTLDLLIQSDFYRLIQSNFSRLGLLFLQLCLDKLFSTDDFLTPHRSRGTISSDRNLIRGKNTVFTTELKVGDKIIVADQNRTVTSITSDVICTIDEPFDPKITPFNTNVPWLIESEGTTKQGRGSIFDGVVIGKRTNFTSELRADDVIIAAGKITTVAAVFSATEIAVNDFFETDLSEGTPFFVPCRGQGTISSTETTVTGTITDTRIKTTSFATELQKNDVIVADGKIRTIQAINSTEELEELTINTAFGEENLSNAPFSFFSPTILFASTSKGGIFRSYNNGGHWEAINTGLSDLEIRSLAVHPHNGYLFAGTANGRLFRSTNLGNIWNPIDVGLSSQSVAGIAIANDDQQLSEEQLPMDILFTGAGNKVFRSSDYGRNWQDIHWQRINQGLTSLTVQAIAIHREQEKLYLFTGTRKGVFSSTDGGQHWQPNNDGLTNLDVQALLGFSSSFQLFAGTKEGLFHSTDYGEHWNPVDIGIAQAEIRALAFEPTNNMLFVATFADGVIRYSPDSDRSIPFGLTDAFLQAMTINPVNGDIYIGTTNCGIFYFTTEGNSWQQLSKIRSGTGKITSDGINVTGEDTQFNRELRVGDQITIVGQKRTVVTISPTNPNTSITIDQPLRRDLRSNTSFTIHTGLTNLNVTALAVYPLAGTGAITIEGKKVTGTGTEFNRELKVGDTITVVDQTGVNQTKTVTEIDPNQEELFVDQEFTRDIVEGTPFTRDIIFAGTAGSGIFRSTNRGQRWEEVNSGLDNHLEIRCLRLDKYSQQILAGTALGGVFASTDLGEHWRPLNTGFTNTDIRAIAVDSNNLFVGGIGILLSHDCFYSNEVQPDDWLYVLRPPEKINSTGQKWQVRNLDQFEGNLTTLNNEDITLYPAINEDPTISEVGKINLPPNDQQLPRLTLEKPLQNSYDPATVTIYGNIIEATHGETVSEEILGSGDGTIANQRFELQKPPLTFISSPTPSGVESTLKVYVNGVEWNQVDALYSLDKTTQSYIIRLEDDGTTEVIFGDGERGARLPSGQENIEAQYRSGIGIAGNISAESLTILKTRPLGIEEVTNPLAANGGAEREELTAARTNAPLTIRTLDRIVSLRDFEDFARTFAGIAKAQAVPLWIADRQLVHITVAAAQGATIPVNSVLYQNLVKAINTVRDPVQQVQVDSYERVIFNLEVKVIINPRYQTEKILLDIRSALEQNFSFARSEFGQVIATSEIIATIQEIKGVTAVDLDALYIRGSSKILNQSLIAQKARWDSQTNEVNPAQLLFIDPDSITLSQSSSSLEV